MGETLPIKTKLSDALIRAISETNPGYLNDDNLYVSLGAGPQIVLTLGTGGFSHVVDGKVVTTYSEVNEKVAKYDVLAHKILLLYRTDMHQIWTIHNDDFEQLHFIIAKGKPIAYYGKDQQIHLIKIDSEVDYIG